ncbi:MAG: D-glycerate dehydrogenase [Candidatus Tectomicrobia bacterium]|uniref:D-glycerate dehydrogenase n=1 Tax=Tectimicrobiota bacterium TaxID=2528274 RepID=A0A932ZSK4_UNCTE|nr:D-glycerate dehydrogenase [Candidatus Tectomicrobia bacterium]
MRGKLRVFLCSRIPEEAERYLRSRCRLEIYRGEELIGRGRLLRAVRDADGLIPTVTERIDAGVMDAAPRLRVIANYGVGFNNIDVGAATARGLPVTNTPEVLTEATADLAFSLILAASRRLGEGERYVRAGRWRGWRPTQLLGRDVFGKTLGVLGMGRIGQAVARRARGFSMKVLYSDARRAPARLERELGVRYVSLGSLLKQADILTIHAPLIPETHHLIGAAALRRMKRTAVVVNAARGPIVDEGALAAALRSGRIAAAGLDVHEREPAVHPELLKLENVVLLPHLGSATLETRTAMGILAAKNCLAALAGRRPPCLVNPEVWRGRGRG